MVFQRGDRSTDFVAITTVQSLRRYCPISPTQLSNFSGSGCPTSPTYSVDRIGFEIDAHTTAIGKVLLAFLEENMQRSMVEHLRFKIYTPYTITASRALYPVLNEVHTHGYAIDRDERYMGRSTLAAPVFDATRQCIAALGMVCDNETFQQHEEGFRANLCRYAEQLSAQMGYYPEPN